MKKTKRFIAVLLTFAILISVATPAYALAKSNFSIRNSEKTETPFLQRVKSEITDFYNRLVLFLKKVFGNKPIRVPEEPLQTILSPRDGSEMHLVWNDEFNGNSLDASKWKLIAKMNQSDIKNGTDEHNIKVENGNLILLTWKENDGTYSTNTSVTTDDIMSFQYGYIEMYANVPFAQGCWPSFWFQSKDTHRTADYMTEIDMFEVYNTRDTIRSDIHKWYAGTEHYNIGGNQIYYKFKRNINLNNEYHLYGFGWTPAEMYFTVDGKIYGRYDLCRDFGNRGDGMQGFGDPIYIIFNNYIFTDNSSWKNPPVNENTQWPVTYRIDWVRLYQKDGEGKIYNDTKK